MNERPTPETDAETMDGSFMEQGCTFTLQQWDYYKAPDGEVVMADFARDLERQRDETRQQLEREQMRLVACDVVAMADTETSRGDARDMHKDYWSAAVESVIRRVDECIDLRKQLEAMREELENLKASVAALEGAI